MLFHELLHLNYFVKEEYKYQICCCKRPQSTQFRIYKKAKIIPMSKKATILSSSGLIKDHCVISFLRSKIKRIYFAEFIYLLVPCFKSDYCTSGVTLIERYGHIIRLET